MISRVDLIPIPAIFMSSAPKAMITHLKLTIAKYKRDKFWQSSERAPTVSTSWNPQLEEFESDGDRGELTAEAAAKAASIPVKGFERKKPIHAPSSAYLPRKRVVIAGCIHR